MSEILAPYYSRAIERAKGMVMEDLDKYIEQKEEMPSYEQYKRERGHYIDQIWLNSWLNTTASQATYSEKIAYLNE